MVLIRDALRVWQTQSQGQVALSSKDIAQFIDRQVLFNILSGDLITVSLFGLFAYFVWRKYQPRAAIGDNAADVTKALGLSLALFIVVGISSYVSEGLIAPHKALPFLPGAGFLPLLAVLCFGVIEAVRGPLREPQIWLIVTGAYALSLLAQNVSFLPFTYLFQPGLSMGIKTSLFFVSDNLWLWWAYLPSSIVLMSCLLYVRLGLIPTLAFMVSHVVFWWVASMFGLDSNPGSLGYWIAFLLVAGFAYRKIGVRSVSWQ